MHSPVLVTAPAMTPVSLPEAKVQLAVDHDEHDDMITAFIAAAVDHLDGWTGILGRALVEQTWRQDFDSFSGCMRIALAPVISITSITYRNAAGQISTVTSSDYTLLADALGPYVEFKSDFERPSDLNETKPVSLTYLAGYPTTPEVPADGETPAIPAVSNIPPAIKAAILIHVRLMYDAYRLGADAGPIPTGAIDALITPYRRVFF
ncbi:hypothetical protein FF80_03340 [Devosia sp. LC5]|uniref:head-tail connector protein n=1 Tax=Devosia sp. LC5 TaxID=1502724 RepID=UPI0004E393C4|nr:phage head-tail connector protein [Devosia sp. LC5]KFC62773.1 hypothetical protein FF80_03340 [Devosia sp. LC5]